MCGRYVSASSPADLAAELGATEIATDDLGARYNVAPTLPVYAAVESHGIRRLGAFRWGLVPSWAKNLSVGSRFINARAESVQDKAAFRAALSKRRCLIPADGFYEWRRHLTRSGTRSQPFLFRPLDGRPLVFAGLWAVWRDPALAETLGPDDGWVRSCTIITTTANNEVAAVHDRMPVVLDRSAWDAWLDRDQQDVDQARGLLRRVADGILDVVAVSSAVNDVRNEGPALLDRAEPTAEDHSAIVDHPELQLDLTDPA